jgi:hypothetical protein
MEDDSARDVAFLEAYQRLDTSPHGRATLSDGGTARVRLRTLVGLVGFGNKNLCLNGVKPEPIAGADFRIPCTFGASKHHSALSLYSSKDGQNIRRARHTTRDIDHFARDEKAPSLLFGTVFAQLLKVEEFTDWTAPPCKEDFVHRPAYSWRKRVAIQRRYLVSPLRTTARMQNQGWATWCSKQDLRASRIEATFTMRPDDRITYSSKAG